MPLFKSLPEDLLIKISDVLEETCYQQGDYIVRIVDAREILIALDLICDFSLLVFRFGKEHAVTHFSLFQRVLFALPYANQIRRMKNSYASWAKEISLVKKHCKGKTPARLQL